MASTKAMAGALLDLHGRSYAQEIGIDIGRHTPSPLFRWLVASVLFSTRIGANEAVSAAKALARAGWRTPKAMARASWAERTKVLNRTGYARYDESTSRMLGEDAELLLNEYGGDLRRLRQKAGQDPVAERRLLKAFKGIGDVGADIFLREVQTAWPEAYPFADRKALEAAGRLGLAQDPAALAKLVPRQDFPLLLAALVRTDLSGDYDQVRSRAV